MSIDQAIFEDLPGGRLAIEPVLLHELLDRGSSAPSPSLAAAVAVADVWRDSSALSACLVKEESLMTRLMRHTPSAALLAATLIGGFFADADAAVIVVTPTDDARGIDGLLDGNFSCCVDPGIVTATLNMSFEERVALEFALGALPSDASITSATLTLHLPVAPLPIPNFAEIHGYAGDGTISAVDMTVSNLLASFGVNAAGAVDISIDPGFIQDLLTTDEDFAGFMLRNVTNPSGVLSMWTSDSGFPQFSPTLSLEYEVVPEPSSLVLMATAMALAARRVRRQIGHTD
jgi:hypothetical protein